MLIFKNSHYKYSIKIKILSEAGVSLFYQLTFSKIVPRVPEYVGQPNRSVANKIANAYQVHKDRNFVPLSLISTVPGIQKKINKYS